MARHKLGSRVLTGGRQAALLIIAIVVSATALIQTPRDVHGGTVGNFSNSDSYESGNHITSGWYGSSQQVTQRYGCTNINLWYPGAEEPASPSTCDFSNNYRWWHQGIDIGLNASSALNSVVSGTVAASSSAPCSLSGQSLGYLAIRTDAGNIVYLLHGCPTSGFFYDPSNPPTVHIGDNVYTTGSNGNSTGAHLHFEVHVSQIGGLYSNPGPGDDINPEGWLFPTPIAGGNQLISLGPASYISEFAISSGPTASLYESDRWPSSWTSWISDGVPLVNGQAQYLLSSQDPVAVRQGPNEWDVFVVTLNGDLALWYKAPNCSGTWLTLAHPVRTTLVNGLAAVSRSSGYLDAFVLSATGAMYHAIGRRGSGCAYTLSWDPTDPFATNPPANFLDVTVASANDNNMYVVAKSGSTVWMTHFDASTWYSWLAFPALPNSYTPVAGTSAVAWTTSTTDGSSLQQLFAFVRGVDQTGRSYQMFYGYYASTGWGGWQTYAEQGNAFVPSSIFIATSWTTFRIDLFVRDSHYRFGGWLWHDAYDPHLYLASNHYWTGWTGQNFYAPPNNEVGPHVGVEALGYPNIDVTSQATPDEVNYRYWHLCYCNNTWDALPVGP